MKRCPIHNMPMRRRHNSTIEQCPRCLIVKNNRIIERSVFKKAPKFNLYQTTAWKWFSRYVLLYYADKNAVAICATSGRRMSINSKQCHAGHYIKVNDMNSTNYSTAFDFRNVAPQYYRDNHYGGGRMDRMREHLVGKHGEDAIKELEAKRHQAFHLDKATLDQIAAEYKAKFKQLLIDREMQNPWEK
ncbi:recombination protein NinG [Sunxiuqinia indica]|uniref:recombination protein NinG n=1 Tax=Sunxiuqinia indica TaxID=2692584 RepID=UPI00135985B8|nr:recombination protein NinG [Sunxiuqinia indica]